MSIVKFYTRLVQSIGMDVSDDGFIMFDDEQVMVKNSLPLVMPTTAHINSTISETPDGGIEINKVIYNPINEDVVKGDSESLKITKMFIEDRLARTITAAGAMLLELARNEKLQSKTSMELNNFLMSLNDAKNKDVDKVVDEKSIDSWIKLPTKMLKDNVKPVTIFLKKLGVMDSVKFNRLATTKFELYDALMENTSTNDAVLGTKLRGKDIRVFKLLFKYLVPDLEEHSKIQIGSNDGESPAFIALMKTYLKVMPHLTKTIKSLKDISEELYDGAYVSILIKDNELDTLSQYKTDLLMIPSELDTNRKKVVVTMEKPQPVVQQQQNYPYQQPTQQVVQQQVQEDPTRALLNKVLYGSGVNLVTPVIQQQVAQPVQQYLPQQYMQPQQQQQVPMGLSSMMSPQMQQPQQYLPQQGYAVQQPQYYGQPQQPQYYGQPQQPMYPTMQGNYNPYPQVQPGGVNTGNIFR